MILPFSDIWRCQGCAQALGRQRPRPAVSFAEEHTCDRCRTCRIGQALTPAILKQDIWTVFASFCVRCEGELVAIGGRISNPS